MILFLSLLALSFVGTCDPFIYALFDFWLLFKCVCVCICIIRPVIHFYTVIYNYLWIGRTNTHTHRFIDGSAKIMPRECVCKERKKNWITHCGNFKKLVCMTYSSKYYYNIIKKFINFNSWCMMCIIADYYWQQSIEEWTKERNEQKCLEINKNEALNPIVALMTWKTGVYDIWLEMEFESIFMSRTKESVKKHISSELCNRKLFITDIIIEKLISDSPHHFDINYCQYLCQFKL